MLEEQRIRVLAVAAEALTLLHRGLSRGRQQCPKCEYSPEVIRYFLHTWPELESATAGVASPGFNPIGSGSRDRLKLAAIKADIEQATDSALYAMLHWQAAARIYKRQGRFKHYLGLRSRSVRTTRSLEPSQPLAEAQCIERISWHLGWRAHDICEVS